MTTKGYFIYFTVHQFVAGLEYYRTIRLQYDGKATKFLLYASKPEPQEPEGFRKFLEMAARQGYENILTVIQKDIEDGKITVQ